MKQLEIRGVALDMDGLMFDTEPLYHQAADELLERRGHRYEDVVRTRMMGLPGPKAIQVMVDYYGLTDSWEDVLAESDTIFARLLGNNPLPLPGLQAFLDLLDSLQLPYGVATSSRRKFAEEILTVGGVLDRMQFLWTGDDVRHGKPDPEIYLRAAQSLQIKPENLLVLEDSGNGCAAGVAATAVTVAVPGKHSQDHDFSGATLRAVSLQDPHLWSLVRQSCVIDSPARDEKS